MRYFASHDTTIGREPPAPKSESSSPISDDVPISETSSTDKKEGTPPAPKISLDLLRRRQAQKKDQELVEKFISPEIYPPIGRRSKILDYLERQDCFKRRIMVDIPEFYVGK